MTDLEFESKALRVNLERTRPAKISFSEEHVWFMEITRSSYGIHRRAEGLLKEFHHPYSNHALVVKLLREIALQDIWFYKSHDQSARALTCIVAVFESFIERDLDSHLLERALQTLLELTENLLNTDPEPAAASTIDHCLGILEKSLPANRDVEVRASSFLKKLGPNLAAHPEYKSRMITLLKTALIDNLEYWRESSNIEAWFHSRREYFLHDYSDRINRLGTQFFDSEKQAVQNADTWEDLLPCSDFKQISAKYRNLMDDVPSPLDRIYYILYLLRLPGMSHLKDQLLWDLNRTLRSHQEEISSESLTIFIERIFSFFEELKPTHLSTVLDCIKTLGREIYATNNIMLINRLIDLVIRFGFVPPRISGVDSNWQILVDPNHIKTIRVWMNLIECNPGASAKLLSALIVNLKTEGIFISDTDLFQRDVTRLLNADIASSYKLVKQLTRLFPVYFSEIGAEGELRDITTAMDELTYRQDKLIHFLRKQVHTESNNTHLELTRKIVRFWHDGDISPLEIHLPEDIREAVTNSGPWFDPVHDAVTALCNALKIKPETIPDTPVEQLNETAAKLPESLAGGVERVLFLVKLQVLLKQKYTLGADGIVQQLQRLSIFPPNTITRFNKLLSKKDPEKLLKFIFKLMNDLRKVILNPEPSHGREDIYHKRHIAAGIPSMYGRYLEPKFQALGLTFRLEQLADKYLDRWIADTNLGYITARTLRRIVRILELFRDGLELDGVSNEGFNSNLNMFTYSLTTASFSMDQFLNLFQFMAKNIKEIIQEYFLGYHDTTLKDIVTHQTSRNMPVSTSHVEILQAVHRDSETFYREIITSDFLIQQLDNFLADILNTLKGMLESLTSDTIRNVMSYDPDLISSPINKPTPELDNQVFLGAKGYFLKKLYAFGFPTPPGFILTTEVFRRRTVFSRYPEMFREIFKHISYRVKEMETATGKRFGDPENPLLLSVRSGAAISLPGAMNTFLNVGMNNQVAEKLSVQPNYPWTSWDCYRRFLQSWGMAYGISRDKFDETIIHYKRLYRVKEKIQFTPLQMRTIAYSYKDVLVQHGVKFEEDLFRQLIQAIFAVLDSWFTDRAKIYRKQLQIAEEWGTAVIVQEMVLGNINYDSGTGVVFTKDPFDSSPGVSLFGDFTMCSQGEDVVAGLVHTLPVSESQRQRSPQNLDKSLEKDFPEIYDELLKRSQELIYERGFGHQEIEFTFESNRREDFHILQTRDQVTQKKTKIPVFEDTGRLRQAAGYGIGVGGGAMNGYVAFDQEDLTRISEEHPEANRILVRPDTVPDDIGLIFNCEGLLTARGGATSHAAVTAVRLGKTCIVNCRVLKVNEGHKKCNIKGVEFQSCDRISIDGRLGNIYKGHYPIVFAPMELT
jgi:pyruvate, orthophosphate dikinase